MVGGGKIVICLTSPSHIPFHSHMVLLRKGKKAWGCDYTINNKWLLIWNLKIWPDNEVPIMQGTMQRTDFIVWTPALPLHSYITLSKISEIIFTSYDCYENIVYKELRTSVYTPFSALSFVPPFIRINEILI